MAKFHIKENGEPGKCTARFKACPLGGPDEHFGSKQEARDHFECVMEGQYSIAQLAHRDAAERAAVEVYFVQLQHGEGSWAQGGPHDTASGAQAEQDRIRARAPRGVTRIVQVTTTEGGDKLSKIVTEDELSKIVIEPGGREKP